MNKASHLKNKLFKVLVLACLFSLLSAASVSAKWVTSSSGAKSWTVNGKKATGWTTISGGKYYFDKNGILQTNRWIGNYYVNSKGAMVKGLVNINKVTYFFSVSNGQVVKNKNIKYKNNYYRTDKNGKVYKNCWIGSNYYAGRDGAFIKGFAKIRGNLYFFYRNNCKKLTSKMVATKSGTYFFMKDGKAVKNQRVKYKNKIYGFNSNYKMVKKGTLKIGSRIYYFGADGVMQTGLQKINGKEFYFFSNGAMAVNRTFTVGRYSITTNSKGVVTKKTKISVGAAIAAYAQKFVGNPYVWGGTDPVKGADCSGFCYAILGHFGFTMPRVADDQLHGPGKVIQEKDMLPGDQIFWNTKGGSSNYACHVVIYIGNDKICHAANTKKGIIVQSLSEYRKWMQMVGIRRYWS